MRLGILRLADSGHVSPTSLCGTVHGILGLAGSGHMFSPLGRVVAQSCVRQSKVAHVSGTRVRSADTVRGPREQQPSGALRELLRASLVDARVHTLCQVSGPRRERGAGAVGGDGVGLSVSPDLTSAHLGRHRWVRTCHLEQSSSLPRLAARCAQAACPPPRPPAARRRQEPSLPCRVHTGQP